MNLKHLTDLLNHLKLGPAHGQPQPVAGSRGGSKLWKIATVSGCYAIKQLSDDLNMLDQSIITRYELTETVASEFSKQGLCSLPALTDGKHVVFIYDEKGYLVYPWVPGRTLDRDEVSAHHAIRIATLLANIHNAQRPSLTLTPQRFDTHTNEAITRAINMAKAHHCPFADLLQAHLPLLLTLNDQYHNALAILQETSVLTHGDLDQLNVIWSGDNQPTLIDWESTRLMNPTRDLIRTCLSWSGLGSNRFSLRVFERMIAAFLQAHGNYRLSHVNAALQSLPGSGIHWILYNVRTACQPPHRLTLSQANNEIRDTLFKLTSLITHHDNLQTRMT